MFLMTKQKGIYLKGEKLQAILSEAIANEEFQTLSSDLKAAYGFNVANEDVRLAYQFEEVMGEGDVVEGSFVVLQSKDNKINIRFDKTKRAGKENIIVTAKSVVSDENGKETLKTLLSVNGTKIPVDDQPYAKELEQVPELPHDPNYVPGELAEEVTAQATFCLYDFPEFYNHCGPNCGDGLSLGGGTPINGLDSCCRAHDRCWKQFGNGDCECDVRLYACAAGYMDTYPTNAAAVMGWFGNVNNC
jgi:hypothetical protein